tara:strand:+ start:652 stop:783 length:132 start_codon:yes stop_codon:yes gene_type:complete
MGHGLQPYPLLHCLLHFEELSVSEKMAAVACAVMLGKQESVFD